MLLGCLSAAYAQVDKSVSEQITQGLKKTVPNLPKIDEIKDTPWPGMYEVRHTGSELFYSNADGTYIIQGNLIDTVNKKNLTQTRMSQLTAIDFKSLPFQDSFTITKGNGKRKIAIFEDPNCGYCKLFEKEIQQIPNATLYVFLYPVLGADSVKKSGNIWCSKDKKQTWIDWMVNNKAIPEAQCDTGVLERNVKLGRKFGITGTPTLVFSDGTKIPGALKLPQIEEKLKEIK